MTARVVGGVLLAALTGCAAAGANDRGPSASGRATASERRVASASRVPAAPGNPRHASPTADAVALAALDERQIVHLLNRVTFGPRPGDLERVRAMGPGAYLERQLDPARIDDTTVERALAALPTLAMSIPDLLREYPRPDPATKQKLESGQMTRRDLIAMSPPEKRSMRIVAELQAAKALRAVESERQLQELMVDRDAALIARDVEAGKMSG